MTMPAMAPLLRPLLLSSELEAPPPLTGAVEDEDEEATGALVGDTTGVLVGCTTTGVLVAAAVDGVITAAAVEEEGRGAGGGGGGGRRGAAGGGRRRRGG